MKRTLYTLDSKKKVRVFEVDINLTASEDYCIITKTGLLEGKLIEERKLISSGKQNRTKEQQAELQANALWQEKVDEGYKSLEMLKGKFIEENPSNHFITRLTENELIKAYLEVLPKASYTNGNWDELPMLAHKFKDIKKPEFPYIGQPKLNGLRCLVKQRNNLTLLCSRGGQYYQIPHLEEALRELLSSLKNNLEVSLILDGEIYKHGVPLQEISGAARSEEKGGLFTRYEWLEYHIYDIINLDRPNQTQELRELARLSLQDHISSNSKSIKLVESLNVYNTQEVKELHDKYISEGYEGLILRNPQAVYHFNERSKDLLKVKEYKDEEFKIIGCDYDSNKSLEESFVFILQNNINSLTFKARPTGTKEQKRYWYENPDSWINKKATVRYFERSNDGLPLQGTVRHKDSKVLLIEHLRPLGE